MIEGHTARDQVAADFPGIEVHVIVAPERFDRLALNQGEFEIREWFEKGPLPQSVAVAFQSNSRYSSCLVERLHPLPGSSSDVNRFHRSSPHGGGAAPYSHLPHTDQAPSSDATPANVRKTA